MRWLLSSLVISLICLISSSFAWGELAQAPPSPIPSIAAATIPAAAPQPAEIQVQDVINQTVNFKLVGGDGSAKAPKSINTGLFDLEYVATLKPHDGSFPYFLFTANPCSACSAERALYLIRPPVSGKPQITPFVYPGKVLDPRTRAVVLESRAFYGRCIALVRGDPGDDVYVVFQRERVDSHHGRRHHILDSVYVAHASSDFLRDQLIERRLPRLHYTLARVKLHQCHEISGRNRLMELHPRGLDWRNLQQRDRDDPDDNQDDMDDTSPNAEASPSANSASH